MSFADKVVLVTGASSGIGAAIAIKFCEEGAKVALIGRNESKLKNVFEQCQKRGGTPFIIIADMTKDDDVKRIVNDTIKRFGKLDILVNNAGVGGGAPIEADNALQIFDQIISTNLRAVVYTTNLAVPHLIKTKGNIINISSVASTFVMPSSSAYCTSKAGLDHFTRCVALELAPKGVRVNSVNPGPVKTDIMQNTGLPPEMIEKLWESFKKNTPLGRVGESEEVADLVLFLASDKAKSITGSIYVTDNGQLLTGFKQPELS